MANKKDTSLTENTAPLGSDLTRMVDAPASSPLSQKVYWGSLNFLPDSWAINYTISVTVANNDLTVALKTKSGGNPSATDPVSAWFNGTYRRGTASLSVTKADATNWGNAGSAALATKELDWFVYLIWNTTPATDILDIGFSRYPGGRVYSDFSTTTTNEKYLAYGNASQPTATDACILIGRFAATLSAGAGYTWSVPTFTNANLLQYPVSESRWLDWTPAPTASGSLTYTSVTVTYARYRIIGGAGGTKIEYTAKTSGTLGGSASNILYLTLPFDAVQASNAPNSGSGATAAVAAIVNIAADTPDKLAVYKYDQSNYATSGTCVVNVSGFFEV